MHFIALARHLETQIEQLMAPDQLRPLLSHSRRSCQGECRENHIPELQATLLRLALSYERIADSVEPRIRRLVDNAGNNISSLLADGGRGSHRIRRLSSSTSGIAPLKKQDEEGGHG